MSGVAGVSPPLLGVSWFLSEPAAWHGGKQHQRPSLIWSKYAHSVHICVILNCHYVHDCKCLLIQLWPVLLECGQLLLSPPRLLLQGLTAELESGMGGQDVFKGLTDNTPCWTADTLQGLQLTDLRHKTSDVTAHCDDKVVYLYTWLEDVINVKPIFLAICKKGNIQ